MALTNRGMMETHSATIAGGGSLSVLQERGAVLRMKLSCNLLRF